MKKLKARFIILVMLAGLGVLVWQIYERSAESWNNQYSSFGGDIPDGYPYLGMDVSHYQGDINWEQVSKMRIDEDTIQFVFIKATEGLTVEDDKKRDNAFGARSVEIDYSFYHFFIPTLSAKKQAKFFCEEIQGYNFDLRPVLDVEMESDFSGERMRDSVDSFLDYVEDHLEVRPIVYTYSNMFQSTFSSSPETFWIAKYSRNCPAMSRENVIAWQFTEKGTVDGINEKVDLNVAKEGFFNKVGR